MFIQSGLCDKILLKLSFTEVIVGVNKYKLKEEGQVDVLCIDNSIVKHKQIERITKVRESRDKRKVSPGGSQVSLVV